jgi:trigger factor
VEITVEDLSPIKKRIGVALPPEEVGAEIDRAYRGLQRHARIKGFRQGKVPRAVLEKYYGEQVRSEVIGKLIQDSYVRALEERNLRAVTRPEVVAEEVRPEAGLRYSATIEIKPAFEVSGHRGIEIERAVVPVSDEMLDAHLERLRESFAQMVRLDDRDTAAAGDLVEIAYTGVLEGRALPGASAASRIIEIGSRTFPPPFEERLIGRRVGESTHIDVPYPPQHHSQEIAGKTVTFRVEVKAIGRKELPVLDDEFAKDHGECGSLVELREKLRRALEETAGREADERMRAALLRELTERNPLDVPEGMVERRVETLLRELGADGVRAGGDAELQQRLDALRAEVRRQARASVHAALLLERLAEQERIEVTSAETDARIAEIVRAAPRERDRLADLYRSPEARREITERLTQEKALDWLVAHAVVREVSASNSIAGAEKRR